MKKLNYLILFVGFLSLSTTTLWAQSGGTGINTDNPQATLDIKTDHATPQPTDGLLIPRMDDFPVTNPGVEQDGMMVFITGNGAPAKGFYYWDHSAIQWQTAGGAGSIDGLSDGKSDGSSIFLGTEAGVDDDGSDNRNVGIGYRALYSNTEGEYNVAQGYRALYHNTGGLSNIAQGFHALYNNSTGNDNIAQGFQALYYNTTGNRNIAVGHNSLYKNTIGNTNIAQGYQALYYNTTGNRNIAVGHNSLYKNTIGNTNIAQGYQALYNNTSGSLNIAQGDEALYSNTFGGGQHRSGLPRATQQHLWGR